MLRRRLILLSELSTDADGKALLFLLFVLPQAVGFRSRAALRGSVVVRFI